MLLRTAARRLSLSVAAPWAAEFGVSDIAAVARGAGVGTLEVGKYRRHKRGISGTALVVSGVVGTLGWYIMYNKKGSEAMYRVQDAIDDSAAISPGEITTLREENNVTCAELVAFATTLRASALGGRLTEAAFAELATPFFLLNRPEGFAYHHHLERVLLSLFRAGGSGGVDVDVLLAAMSLVVSGTPAQRMDVLYELYSQRDGGTALRVEDAVNVARCLQETWQLPSKFQVRRVARLPWQQFRRKTPGEMTEGALEEVVKGAQKRSKGAGSRSGSGGGTTTTLSSLQQSGLSLEDFRALLTSSSLCVWGECFDARAWAELGAKPSSPSQEASPTAAAPESSRA